MAKAFNNFGAGRATVTPTVTLSTGSTTPIQSNSTNLSAQVILLGNTAYRAVYLRRTDKNFYHRMRDYVANMLLPTNPDRFSTSMGSIGANTKSYVRGRKVDVNQGVVKQSIGVAQGSTIDTNTEAWKQYVGKQHIGFPMPEYADFYLGQQFSRASQQGTQYISDNMPDYISNVAEGNTGNYLNSSASINPAVREGAMIQSPNRPDYTPFSMVLSVSASMDSSVYDATLVHPLVDVLSGCTIGQKYSVSELLAQFRDLYFKEVLDYCNHPVDVYNVTALRDAINAQLSPTNKQPYVNASTLYGVNTTALMTLLNNTSYLPTLGTPAINSNTGLIKYEGGYHSGVAGFETIERLMSSGTITAAYTDAILTTNTYTGTATFSKQGRLGALRAMLIVIPDNLKRRQFEMGISNTPTTSAYAGLMSSRPLGKFTTLSSADGWATEVRLKETQLSLVAFGVSRFAMGCSCIGTVVVPNPTQLVLAAGLNHTGNRPMISYTKVNSVDFTINSQACKIFGFADFLSTLTTAYNTTTLCNELETMGGLDPSVGDKSIPTAARATILDTHQVRLCVIVPFEVSGMVKDGSGNVPYFTIAEGSNTVLNTWTSKAAFAYIQGSYNVYTRITTFGQMKATHGSTKTFEECMDLATTAFINECRSYFDVAETDPSPVEQLMAYTPLNSVGYDLPAIRSYSKPQYDYKPYLANPAYDASPNADLIKNSMSVGGMFSGGVGTRLDTIAKQHYGNKTTSTAIHSTTAYTSVDMYTQWLGSSQLPTLPLDGSIGYFHQGEREQVSSKWQGGRLFRLNNSDQTLDTFKYSGRMGFRAASMNSNILSFYGAHKYGFGAYDINVASRYGQSLVHPTSGNTDRTYTVQSEVSPELINRLLETSDVGRAPLALARSLNMYNFGYSTSYIRNFPDKGGMYDFITDATRSVRGVARKDDVPTQFLPVRLYDRRTGELLAQQLSQVGGFYRFYGLQKNRRYCIQVLDPQRDFNSVIEDVEVILT